MEHFNSIGHFVKYELPEDWLSRFDEHAKQCSAGQTIMSKLGQKAFDYWATWHKILTAAAVKQEDFDILYQ